MNSLDFPHKTAFASATAPDAAEFRRLTTQLEALAAGEGVAIQPYAGEPRHFLALDAARRGQILHTFGRYVAVASELKREGATLLDDRRFLWAMIKKLGLRPDSTLFDRLADDDFIEIVDAREDIQIYRNLRYFSVCSYTLDDLLCRPWFELFHRDPAVLDRLMATINATLAAQRPEIFYYNAGVHEVDEISSESRLRCTLENRFLTPLFDQTRRVAAAVNVTRLVACVARAGASPA